MIKLDLRPTDGMLRTFGLIGLVVFAIIACTIGYWGRIVFIPLPDAAERPLLYVFAALAAWCGLGAAVAPRALRPLYVGLTVLSFPIGIVVSYTLTAFVFYGVITPIGLAFKLIGRDALQRRFEPATGSYWIRRPPPPPAARYFRQF